MNEGVWKHLNKECLWKWPLVILAHTSTKAAIVFLLVKQQSSSRWGFFLFPRSIMLAFMCPLGAHPAVWWASTQMHCSGPTFQADQMLLHHISCTSATAKPRAALPDPGAIQSQVKGNESCCFLGLSVEFCRL